MLIVGEGIYGLDLESEMRKLDIEKRIIEKRNKNEEEGLEINIKGNEIKEMESIGMKEKVDEIGYKKKRREYRKEKGKLLF